MRKNQLFKSIPWNYMLLLLAIISLAGSAFAMSHSRYAGSRILEAGTFGHNFSIPDTSIRNKTDSIAPGSKIFSWVDQMPRFQGSKTEEESQNSISQYLAGHILYPEKARKKNIQGKVVVVFIVEPDGTITHVKALPPFKGGGLEKEAVDVIKEMPRWIPGRQNSGPVRVQFTIPIDFRLQ